MRYCKIKLLYSLAYWSIIFCHSLGIHLLTDWSSFPLLPFSWYWIPRILSLPSFWGPSLRPPFWNENENHGENQIWLWINVWKGRKNTGVFRLLFLVLIRHRKGWKLSFYQCHVIPWSSSFKCHLLDELIDYACSTYFNQLCYLCRNFKKISVSIYSFTLFCSNCYQLIHYFCLFFL